MARYIVVNKNDEVIGYKTRDEITPSDIYRVAALWVTNSKGDILLAQRALTKKNSPGLWGPAVAGTVEEGETYEVNIIKEMQEEIGLVGFTPVLGPKVLVDLDRKYWDQWFTLKIDQPIEYFRINPVEVAAIKWFSQEELEKEIAEHPEKFLKGLPSWNKLFL